MRVTWEGNIMVPRRIMNKTGDNLDLNLAKPYATTEEENTVPIVAKNVTTAEFWKKIPKSAPFHPSMKFSSVGFAGSNDGGIL